MGCGSAKSQVPIQGKKVAILIVGAKGLRDADFAGQGTSDPYVVARVGKIGTTWEQKGKETETRSQTIWNNTNPVWRHAFEVIIPTGNTSATWELQLKIFDKDLLDSDDSLGEMKVALAALETHLDDTKVYKLDKSTKGTDAMGKEAGVELMMGSKVESALLDDLKKSMAISKTGDWDYEAIRAVTKWSYFRKYVPDSLNTVCYLTNTLQMALVWITPLKTKGVDPSSDWFVMKTKNGGKEDTYKWDGPELDSLMLSGHADVTKALVDYGAKCGTNATNGQVYHPNFLGVQWLCSKIWPEVPWHGIGLAAPQDARQKIRPLITKLCARWTELDLQKWAKEFFDGRDAIMVNDDLRVWTTRVLHRVLVGIELTEAEGRSFMDMQRKVLIIIAATDDTVDVAPFKDLNGYDEVLAFKKAQIAKFQAALVAKIPEVKAMSTQDQIMSASAVLDAMLFAGGQSVPTVLQYCLAMPYSKWGQDSLPPGFSLDNTSLMPAYIWEVIRRFAPVTMFPYRERGINGAKEKTVYLNLQMAQRDPRVWGADAGEFKLRPLQEYHQKSVGFCEPGLCPTMASPQSRACPAKDLAFSMCLAFMTEFARTVAELLPPGPASVAQVWQAKSDNLEAKKYKPLAPLDLEINLYGTTTFRLDKNAAANVVPAPRSGQELIDKLDPKGRALVSQNVHRHNKFWDTNQHTHLIIKGVQLFASPEYQPSTVVAPPPNKTSYGPEDIWQGPFPGLRFITLEEDETMDGARLYHLTNALTATALEGRRLLTLDEEKEKLIWFDSPAEAVACVDATFGKYLPASSNYWEHIDSDKVMAQVCVDGIGAWYLDKVTPSAVAGHEQPSGAMFEVNLEYMAKYETRSPWIRYGHTAYLGAGAGVGDSTQPKELLAIWSCHHKKLIKPLDALWEHAKAGFRSSLITSVTLKEHLAGSHWLYANGLMCAVRESCGADHPLRRLLKQFYYRTSSVNMHSKNTLFPVDSLGYRTFGFTPTSWVDYFKDIFDNWSWVAFPEKLKTRQLSPEFTANWPLKQDGEALWQVFHKYAADYLKIFYPDDAAVQKDEGVKLFWANFDKYQKWRLPALNSANLAKLLADNMWWVTGGHEFVGAVVEYLTTPFGMGNKIMDGKTVPDVQTFAQELALIALTGNRMPMLMDDWTHIFTGVPGWASAKQQAVLDIVRRLQADLTGLANQLDKANFERERRGQRKLMAFHPRILETSVSI